MAELTPKELTQKHKLKAIGWTYSDLGVLLKLGLVRGTKIARKNYTFIDEQSLIDLLKYYNQVKDQEKYKFHTDAVEGVRHG
jgi:hypothetical protein